MCIQVLLKDEGYQMSCWHYFSNSLFLFPAYRRNKSIPIGKKRCCFYFSLLSVCLPISEVTSLSPVLGLQNPATQAWSAWLRTQWTLSASANYKVLGCTSPNENKWILQLLGLQICYGTVFQPTCYHRFPVRLEDGCNVHCLSDSTGCWSENTDLSSAGISQLNCFLLPVKNATFSPRLSCCQSQKCILVI